MGPQDELLVLECCNPEPPAPTGGATGAVHHLTLPHAGKCAKLNTALGVARHELVLVTDDDCRVPHDWIDSLAAPFANPAVGAVFGPSEGLSSGPGRGPAPVVPPGPAPPELWNYAHGLSMAVRRAAAEDVGGFDERLGPGAPVHGEEGDVVLRMAERGWLTAVAGGEPVRHLAWRTEAETARNTFVYQRGAGAYLGSAVRRRRSGAAKPVVLRLAHERGYWRRGSEAGVRLRSRLASALVAGFVQGLRLQPVRYLEERAPKPPSSGRPRVLWVTDEAPDRHQGGGNIRQARLIDQVHGRIDLTLLLVGSLADDTTRAQLVEVLEVPRPRDRTSTGPVARRARDLWRVLVQREPSEITGARRVRRAMGPVLGRIADDFDVVVVQHLALAPLLPPARRATWILELHNVASARTRHEAADEAGRRQRWLLRREAANAARAEQAAIDAYDGLIVISEEDRARLRISTGHVIPNGVEPIEHPAALPASPTVLLPATLDYRPNVLGARWFCDEVLPRVQAAVPDVRFALVGRHPVAEVLELATRPGVELHADVPAMGPWLEWARVVVVPLWIGTGTRLKALEAMANGRPVVGTTIGLEGLELVDGVHARITDDPVEMAAAISEVLSSDACAGALAAAGRAHVAARFSWSAIGDRLAQALSDRAATARS
jgi:glycosyltransferase involved in cell wall biosynthesis/GT2 family glycosyltransferase